MNYTLENVTSKPHLWENSDPVRPELGVAYKTYPGRLVFGLRDENNEYVAFCCVARSLAVPQDITSLSNFTSQDGTIYVPYTVWSLKKGAGRTIINELLSLVRDSDTEVNRVVTLSPKTEMAKNFHLRNGAREISSSVVTVNFEYPV